MTYLFTAADSRDPTPTNQGLLCYQSINHRSAFLQQVKQLAHSGPQLQTPLAGFAVKQKEFLACYGQQL